MALRFFPWLVFAAALILVAVFYTSLPSDIVIARGLFGGSDIVAPKTLFTAFRVVLIDLLCAFAIEVMRRRPVSPKIQPDYQTFWQVLLFAVAFKCLFQTLELVSPADQASIYFYVTVAVVILGIALAAFIGRKIFSAFDREDWKLNGSGQLLLAGLLIGYLAIAIGPVIFFR